VVIGCHLKPVNDGAAQGIQIGVVDLRRASTTTPSKNRRDLAADVPQRERDVPAHRQRLPVDDLRKLAEACRDLDDPVVMAKALDDPQDTREGARRSPARLITHRFPLEDTVETFRVAQNGSKGVFRVVVES
jgi:hypothetical protein